MLVHCRRNNVDELVHEHAGKQRRQHVQLQYEDEGDASTVDTPDTSISDEINLDELADKVMPYLKRLMKIERERYSPI